MIKKFKCVLLVDSRVMEFQNFLQPWWRCYDNLIMVKTKEEQLVQSSTLILEDSKVTMEPQNQPRWRYCNKEVQIRHSGRFHNRIKSKNVLRPIFFSMSMYTTRMYVLDMTRTCNLLALVNTYLSDSSVGTLSCLLLKSESVEKWFKDLEEDGSR